MGWGRGWESYFVNRDLNSAEYSVITTQPHSHHLILFTLRLNRHTDKGNGPFSQF